MIKEKIHFQSSVNIQFDIGKGDLYERYLPTPSHAESFLGLLKGFLGEGSHAHIIVGPYGSGKSFLATLVADMMLGVKDTEWLEDLQKKFLTVDDDIYSYIDRVRHSDLKFIPVVMSGSGISFRQTILSSLFRALKRHGIDMSVPLFVSEIKQIVSVWKLSYKATFDSFSRLLEQEKWTYYTWIGDIENFDTIAIEWFKSIYPALTSGSHLRLPYDHDIVTQITEALEELKQRGYGIFLLYDEFGRYLQTLSSSEVHAAMQDLQDLAELANHHEASNLNVLLITHRNLGQYALRFNEDLQKEFQRIEKRYSVYYTHADRATFIRLASNVTEEYRRGSMQGECFISELRKFTLFPELTYHEIDSLVIRGSYPLHPVSLFAIPQLANLVGQNERTLFTFLQSLEKGGLQAHVQSTSEWYLVDHIFDYFEPSLSEFEKDSLIGETYLMYSRLQRKLLDSDLLDEELKALKVIALWRVTNLNVRQVLSDEMISFALLWDASHTSVVLSSLQKKKVIRYNSVNGFWDLFEGSSVDVDAEVAIRQERSNLSKRQKANLLEASLTERFILPKHYNDEKSMTRFASIHPAFATELLYGNISCLQFRDTNGSDAAVFFVVDDTSDDSEKIKADLMQKSIQDQQTVYGVPVPKLGNDLEPLVSRLSVINDLLEDKYFLSQDRYLILELKQLKEELVFEINQRMYSAFNSENCLWIHDGTYIKFRRQRLGQYLSDVMKLVFPLTPEIRNEPFNRRKVTKIQLNAAVKVVDLILNSTNDKDLEIGGFGPDYLIFATVVKNTGIQLFGDGTIQNEFLSILKTRLLDVLFSVGKGSFYDLLSIFLTPPFGIRKPVIPLLLVSLLKGNWKQLMFYNNLIYSPDVDGEMLYYMLENPENYTFSFQRHGSRHKSVVREVERAFGDCSEGLDRTLPPAVFESRVLLNWLRSLPKIAQSTTKTSDESNTFKDIIRKSEVEPVEAMDALDKLLKQRKESILLSRLRVECESYFSKHQSFIEEQIYGREGIKTFEDLKVWALSQHNKVKIKNPLIKGIIDSTKETLIDDLSESIVGVKRENWSDATDNLFINQIKVYLNQLSNEFYQTYLEVKIGNSIHVVPDVTLSEKSRLIYNNTRTNLKLMGRTVPKEEVQVVLLQLLKEYLTD